MRYLVVLVALSACASGDKNGTVIDAPTNPNIDAPRHPVDSDVDARMLLDASCPHANAAGPHLLLSEVTLGPDGAEFIEIVNPTGGTVDLSHYFLSDSGSYYRLPAGVPSVGTDDFIVRFPAGASIPDQGVITVATGTAAAFMTAYTVAPTYSIADATITTVAVTGTPTLTAGGEPVALFYWDGTSALVFDVDLLLAGSPSATNLFDDKSGYKQLGCEYATDARTLAKQPTAPAPGKSTKRIALETGHETQGGSGNGLTGDDETSEDASMTWDTTFSNPTPGTVPAAIQ